MSDDLKYIKPSYTEKDLLYNKLREKLERDLFNSMEMPSHYFDVNYTNSSYTEARMYQSQREHRLNQIRNSVGPIFCLTEEEAKLSKKSFWDYIEID